MTARSGILLIGGGGFVGMALARALLEAGEEVHILSRTFCPDPLIGARVHRGGQEDSAILAPILERCDRVVHLASVTTPGDTVWNPLAELEGNLRPTLMFLEILQTFPDIRLVFVSTGGALYGNASAAVESLPPMPASYHGAAKVALEAFFGVFGQRSPGGLTILRPANLYGPGQSLRSGFGIVRTLLERARDGGSVTLWGDGSAVRDFLYIDDMVAACLRALNGATGTYNLGAGRGTSLMQLLAVVEATTGQRLRVEQQPPRASDAARIVLDIERARSQLGWAPMVGLEEGVARTWAWLQQGG